MKAHRFPPAVAAAVLLLSGAADCFAGRQKEKPMGTPEAPRHAGAVAGSYYRGDGTGYNIYLTLGADGKYTAEWYGCGGKYGDASGQWTVTDKQVTLHPSAETGAMKDHLKTLNILKFKNHWIFVPADDHKFYDEWGVSSYACFQRKPRG